MNLTPKETLPGRNDFMYPYQSSLYNGSVYAFRRRIQWKDGHRSYCRNEMLLRFSDSGSIDTDSTMGSMIARRIGAVGVRIVVYGYNSILV